MEKLGRSSRLQYLGFLILPIVGFGILGGLFPDTSERTISFATYTIYALLVIGSIRRSNDIGENSLIVLILLFVPLVSLGLILYLLFASKDSARERRAKAQLETQVYLQGRYGNQEPHTQIDRGLASRNQTQYCSSCGRKSHEGETFCPDCGNKLET